MFCCVGINSIQLRYDKQTKISDFCAHTHSQLIFAGPCLQHSKPCLLFFIDLSYSIMPPSSVRFSSLSSMLIAPHIVLLYALHLANQQSKISLLYKTLYLFLHWFLFLFRAYCPLTLILSLSPLASSLSSLLAIIPYTRAQAIKSCVISIQPTFHFHEPPHFIVHLQSIHICNGHMYQILLHFIVHHPYT